MSTSAPSLPLSRPLTPNKGLSAPLHTLLAFLKPYRAIHPAKAKCHRWLHTLLAFLKPYRGLMLHVFFWMVVVTACGLAGPLLVRDGVYRRLSERQFAPAMQPIP